MNATKLQVPGAQTFANVTTKEFEDECLRRNLTMSMTMENDVIEAFQEGCAVGGYYHKYKTCFFLDRTRAAQKIRSEQHA